MFDPEEVQSSIRSKGKWKFKNMRVKRVMGGMEGRVLAPLEPDSYDTRSRGIVAELERMIEMWKKERGIQDG